MAVIVDLIDEAAKKFYAKYGFIKLPDSEKMFMAMKTIADLFDKWSFFFFGNHQILPLTENF